MHLKACVVLLALLMSSTPPLCQLAGCHRLQLTSHSLYNKVSPCPYYSLLLFSATLLSQIALDMSSLLLFLLSLSWTLLDAFGYSFSLSHNKTKLSPDHGVAILIVSLLCPVYSLDLLF